MAASILSVSVNENHEKFLDDISKSHLIDWALWIGPDEIFLEDEDIKAIIDSFASNDLVCLLSKISHAGAMPIKSKITEYKRVFYNWRNLAKNVLIKNSFIEEVTGDKYYCDTTYATGTDCAAVTSIVNRSAAGYYDAISFFPLDEKKIEIWSTVALQFLSQMLKKEIQHTPYGFLPPSGTLLEYIESTIKIGGIPVVLWKDANMRRGLVCLGNKDCLTEPFKHMSNHLKQLDSSELDYWNIYGISFIGAGY